MSQQTTLLDTRPTDDDPTSIVRSSADCRSMSEPELSPLRAIAKVGSPVALQFLVQVGSSVVVFVVLSRCTDELVLAGYALANVLCNLLGLFITWGFCAGYDTIAAQAWGANEPQQVGVVGQRVVLMQFLLICLPLSLAWWFASPILEACGQDRAVAQQASLYARISLPNLWANAVQVVLSKAQSARVEPVACLACCYTY